MSRPLPPNIGQPMRDALVRGEMLYQLRCRVAHKVGRLELPDLERLVKVLEALSDADMRSVARFAEALAEWPDPESSSSYGDPNQG